MNLTLADCKKIKSSFIVNEKFWNRKYFRKVSTDSRDVSDGDLYFAIRGENFDGHDFVLNVIAKKSVVVVVDRKWFKKNKVKCLNLKKTIVTVSNTTLAYGNLAKIYREKFSIPIIAIAGSNGKTTTKEMVKAILKTKYNVLATEANFNNHIGVPKTIFNLNGKHDIAVFEVGSNHHGELKYLCDVLNPTDSAITNIGREHLEFFKNLNGVMKEEGKVFDLKNKNGIRFVNGDDQKIFKFAKKYKNKITFGSNKNFDFYSTKIQNNNFGKFSYQLNNHGKKNIIILNLPGSHNIQNSLLASTIGKTFDISSIKIAFALKNFVAPQKRMEFVKKKNVLIINDSYNANPDSMILALKTLSTFKNRKIAVLGDMFELGEFSKSEHEKIGKEINKLKIDFVFTIGNFMKLCNAKIKNKVSKHFNNRDELLNFLKTFIKKNDVVLFKGSRGMKMEYFYSEIFLKGN